MLVSLPSLSLQVFPDTTSTLPMAWEVSLSKIGERDSLLRAGLLFQAWWEKTDTTYLVTSCLWCDQQTFTVQKSVSSNPPEGDCDPINASMMIMMTKIITVNQKIVPKVSAREAFVDNDHPPEIKPPVIDRTIAINNPVSIHAPCLRD